MMKTILLYVMWSIALELFLGTRTGLHQLVENDDIEKERDIKNKE